MTEVTAVVPMSRLGLIASALALIAALLPSPLVAQATPYKLSVSKSGNGTGTVSSQVGGIDCGSKCANSYSPLVPVQLQARGGTGIFVGWSGDCSGTNVSCNLVMTKDRNVRATFDMPKVNVTKVAAARDFQVVSSKPGIDCGGSCAASFESGSTITLEAKGGPSTLLPKWPGGTVGRTHTIVTSSPLIVVNLETEPTLLAVAAAGYPEFRVRETNQTCQLSPGLAGACRLALEKGKTFTLTGVGGTYTWSVNPGGVVCRLQFECQVRIDTDRQTVVTMSR